AWNAKLQQARGAGWPSHVHVFDTPTWTHVALATVPGVRVWGRAFVSSSGTMDRPLARAALAGVTGGAPGSLDVALFHGSREGRCPPTQKITAPFSDAEVLASPFAYHAVGHYHTRSEIEQEPGEATVSIGVRLAYAGSPVALSYSEPGEHGALEGSIRFDHERRVVGADAVRLDRRRMLAVGADVIAREFHVKWEKGGVRPDYDLDALRAGEGRTTEQRFARELLSKIDAET